MLMRKFLIFVLIFFVPFSSLFGISAYGEELKEISFFVTENGRTIFEGVFTLNPEFIKIAKGREQTTINELRQGFSDKELLNYLFYDAGDRLYAEFDEIDDVKKEDCIVLSGGKFYYYPEKSARIVERNDFFDVVMKSLHKREVKWEIKFKNVEAKYNLSELKECTNLIATYSTYYGSSTSGRKYNIALASRFLTGKAIGAGEIFSFNKVVGKRTAERGFESAKVIQDGVYIEGVGGGVCQVATTLYNATLRAGLNPVSVARHTLAPSYVPLSFDAMVSDSTDLKIKNEGITPVFMWLNADGERLTVKIYGKKEDAVTYEFESETVSIVKHKDMTEETALSFRDGYKSKGYKLVYRNGELKEKILIREDFYKPYRI